MVVKVYGEKKTAQFYGAAEPKTIEYTVSVEGPHDGLWKAMVLRGLCHDQATHWAQLSLTNGDRLLCRLFEERDGGTLTLTPDPNTEENWGTVMEVVKGLASEAQGLELALGGIIGEMRAQIAQLRKDVEQQKANVGKVAEVATDREDALDACLNKVVNDVRVLDEFGTDVADRLRVVERAVGTVAAGAEAG